MTGMVQTPDEMQSASRAVQAARAQIGSRGAGSQEPGRQLQSKLEAGAYWRPRGGSMPPSGLPWRA